AGAGIAAANPMRAGVTALRIAIAGFLIPYVFILEPALLLQGTVSEMLIALVTLILGMVGVSAGLAGYFFGSANVVERLLLVAGGIALVYPNLWVSAVGLGALVIIAAEQKLRKATTSDQIAKELVEQKA
ncbi:MAG: TRAP transporter permease, partial [Brevibacterium aurantiacum]